MSERSFREPRRRGFEDEVFVPRRPRAFGAAAPRRQLPSGPPLRATVKWFSPEKGFGFVVLEDGSGDAFLHAGVIQQSGHDPADLPSGATLLVRIEIGQKGPQISEVLEVDKSTATVAVRHGPHSGRRPLEGTAVGRQPGRMTGTVKSYNPEKRYGSVEGGQREVFVRARCTVRVSPI
jgi:cold shock protein